ncbi:helix-turn-helix domain-containing protein [Pseudonocardia sp.]|uniref:helix-turn-helix domain-containing protein n=1 Tax=Pseudonocardia sp. TaxID=60912 RepID=UPI003D107F12
MDDPIDADELRRRVVERRRELGLSLRAAAEDSGVPFNTLSRVEKGHLPDLANFSRLVAWVGLDPAAFFRATPRVRTESTPAVIRTSLHADRHLTPDAADQIAELVNQLYTKLATQIDDAAVHLRAQTTFTPGAAKLMDVLVEQLQGALLADDTLGAEPGWEV